MQKFLSIFRGNGDCFAVLHMRIDLAGKGHVCLGRERMEVFGRRDGRQAL